MDVLFDEEDVLFDEEELICKVIQVNLIHIKIEFLYILGFSFIENCESVASIKFTISG